MLHSKDRKTLENNWRNGADDKAKPFTGTD
jgi:hypothetical protein